MSVLDKAALKAIDCYKVHISPHKGWRCAYGATHGISCSTVVQELITEHGVIDARPFIKQQFDDCREEYNKLLEERQQTEESKPTSESNGNRICDACDVHSCTMPFWFPTGKSSKSNCDIVDCDVGGCDVGPC